VPPSTTVKNYGFTSCFNNALAPDSEAILHDGMSSEVPDGHPFPIDHPPRS
jgi:hypothetical protein